MAGINEGECVVDVWDFNLEEEFAQIREFIDQYPYISMDTEFPGVVAKPVAAGGFKNHAEYNYHALRCNVDLLKIIQVGLTFSDKDGNPKPGKCTWQFNFKFSLNTDMYARKSIDLLHKSGVDFDKHAKCGISAFAFAELLMVSGIVLNENVHWIVFHAGYDFGYLLKLLTCLPLPKSEPEFMDLLLTYFPNVYDVKFMMTASDDLKGGLQKLADDLGVERVGQMHTAGSDSLLTLRAFLALCKELDTHRDDLKNVLYGLGKGAVTSQAVQDHPAQDP